MEIEVTGTIRAATEVITQVDLNLDYEAEYELRLKLDLDHRSYLALKRMNLLGETLRVTLRAAQLELPVELQETMEAAAMSLDD